MGYVSGIIWTDELIGSAIMELANQFDPPRMPTKSEMVDMRGDYALSCAVSKHGGFGYWANRLKLEQKHSDTKLGIEGERLVATCLKTLGFKVETTSIKYPYDLLIDGCIKIDVKTANTSYVRGYPIHSYRLAKGQPTCDFYVFLEADTKRIYVVPSSKLSGQVQVGMGIGSSPYAKYLGAFDLIKEASDMYRHM